MTTPPEALPAYASSPEQAARIRAQIAALVAGWGPMPAAKVSRTVQLLGPHFTTYEKPAHRRKAS